ncbi:hypothetical protein [Geoglobus acetivorans]|uniref:Uncharacterized protein n=1 Tax=Geoglobus acetivorans TaxID=565033 RepID=A0ABZ3H4P6_GEOAI|nr:hypothetical protein [Geoglobus acetivorans]
MENNNGRRNLLEVYYEHTKKVAPYLTVYSALITVSAIFLVFANQLKSIDLLMVYALKLSGVFFGFSGFSGISASLIYIYWRGELPNWKKIL